MRNFGSRISALFERKKKDVTKEAEETKDEIEKATEDTVNETVQAVKSDTEKVGDNLGKRNHLIKIIESKFWIIF